MVFHSYQALKTEIKQRESMWSKVYWEMVEPVVNIRTLRARLASTFIHLFVQFVKHILSYGLKRSSNIRMAGKNMSICLFFRYLYLDGLWCIRGYRCWWLVNSEASMRSSFWNYILFDKDCPISCDSFVVSYHLNLYADMMLNSWYCPKNIGWLHIKIEGCQSCPYLLKSKLLFVLDVQSLMLNCKMHSCKRSARHSCFCMSLGFSSVLAFI